MNTDLNSPSNKTKQQSSSSNERMSDKNEDHSPLLVFSMIISGVIFVTVLGFVILF